MKKRSLPQVVGAKAKAKAKVAPAPPPAPVPAPVLPPDPPAVAALTLPCTYVHIPGHGDIVYTLGKINAHCLCPHLDFLGAHAKCHMDRSIPYDAEYGGGRVKGRPIGLLMAWLKASPATKAEHELMKNQLNKPEHYEQRKLARRELWEMRLVNPAVAEIFAAERQDIVPADFEEAPQLYEPLCVF